MDNQNSIVGTARPYLLRKRTVRFNANLIQPPLLRELLGWYGKPPAVCAGGYDLIIQNF